MINKDFWYDALRSGAILGIVMAVSRIFELYLLAFSDGALMTMSIWYLVEWVIAAGVFVWLVVRFSKRRAADSDPKYGYSYSVALSYILTISMLAGIIVGTANTLFIGAMGYEAYVEGMVGRIDQMRELYAGMNLQMYDADFNKMIAAMRSAEQPSMLSTVFASLNNYLLTGGILGLIIAGVVSRRPQMFSNEHNDNE